MDLHVCIIAMHDLFLSHILTVSTTKHMKCIVESTNISKSILTTKFRTAKSGALIQQGRICTGLTPIQRVNTGDSRLNEDGRNGEGAAAL